MYPDADDSTRSRHLCRRRLGRADRVFRRARCHWVSLRTQETDGHHWVLPRLTPHADLGRRDLDRRDLALRCHVHRRAEQRVSGRPHLSRDESRHDPRGDRDRVLLPPSILSIKVRIDLRSARAPIRRACTQSCVHHIPARTHPRVRRPRLCRRDACLRPHLRRRARTRTQISRADHRDARNRRHRLHARRRNQLRHLVRCAPVHRTHGRRDHSDLPHHPVLHCAAP